MTTTWKSPKSHSQLLPILVLATLGLGSLGTVGAAHAVSKPSRKSTPTDSRDPQATDRIIVRMADGSTPDIAALSRQAGESVTLSRRGRDGSWVSNLTGRRSPADVEAITGRIAALPGVAFAEPDRKVFATAVPTDPSFSKQWDLFAPTATTKGLDITGARAVTSGTSDVVVAVVDTGITPHIELAGQVLPGYDMVSDVLVANDGDLRDSNAADPGDWVTTSENSLGYFAGCGASNSSWHGTHVSGTIAAKSDNGIGIAGIAPGIKILPVRVLGKCGGYESDVADGIRWAAGLAVPGAPTNPNPAAIISLSLGGGGACPAAYQTAITDAIAVGSIVVVAAGNSNADAATSAPANCAGVIAVAATGPSGNRSWYSNFGTTVNIAAQGGDDKVTSTGGVAAINDTSGEIYSTLNAGLTSPTTDTYAFYEGTSMATPHVSAVAALVKSLQPSLTPAGVLALLQRTVTPFAATSTCTTALCGPGILNAASAVAAAAANGPRTLGAFSKIAPGAGATGTGTALTLQWAPSTGAASYEYCLVAGLTTPCTTWTSTGLATSIAVTGLAAGTIYSWQVRAVAGTVRAEANVSLRYSFTTAIPVGAFGKLTPSNGATGLATALVLSWQASTGATAYQYCIDTILNNTCDTTWISTGLATSVVPSALLGGTTYEWQVKTTTNTADAGAAWSFTTVAPSKPLAFGKTAPANAATGLATTPGLDWQTSSGASSYDYCIDTVINNLCDATWISTGTLTTIKPGTLLANTKYEWQVRSVSSVGTTVADASVAWTFTTSGGAAVPAAFALTAPSNNATGLSTSPGLSWQASSGATSYQYCADTVNDNICGGTWVSTGTTRTAKLSGLLSKTKYYWMVRAVNTGGTTSANAGTWWAFTTL